MNTPAHLIFGIAAFGRAERRGTVLAAALGGLAPDLSLYIMAGVALWVLQIPGRVVFDELYFSDAWQTVFAIDNSALLWGGALALALWRRWPRVVAFAGAGLLHVALDFPLHHDDGRPHFWPLSDWVFESPISYWDHRHHAGIVSPIEALSSICLAAYAAWHIPSWGWRLVLAVALAAQLWITGIWFTFIA